MKTLSWNRYRGLAKGLVLVTLGLMIWTSRCWAAGAKTIPIPKTIQATTVTADPAGKLSTLQPAGATETASNAFFQSLGSNERSCFSCHAPADGWSISAAEVAGRFKKTRGTDPLFRLVDGASCPNDDVSTPAAKTQAYQLLLGFGLIRISLPMPSQATLQFHIVSVDDPYHCNTNPAFGLTSSTSGMVSVYRRPLPATNLRFETTLMWDGREASLESQATNATLRHAEAAMAPDSVDLQQIKNFESGIFTAQSQIKKARDLGSNGVTGGPAALAVQPFFLGMNDPFGANPMGTPFDPDVFTLYKAWENPSGKLKATEQSIARGERIFNSRTFTISGVAGLTDVIGQESISGTCSTCHDTPNVGNRSVDGLMDIGTANPTFVIPTTPRLPLFTIHCDGGTHTGQTYTTFDPGRALITGRCEDIGKFKVPVLRGLAARAPYFHSGVPPTLSELSNFYKNRFPTLTLTDQETADLTSFLNSL